MIMCFVPVVNLHVECRLTWVAPKGQSLAAWMVFTPCSSCIDSDVLLPLVMNAHEWELCGCELRARHGSLVDLLLF